MMIKNLIPIILIFAIIVIFTLTAFFLLNIELTTINIWALIFILVSEIAAFITFAYLRVSENCRNNIFLKSGTIVSVSLYFIASLIFNIIAIMFMNNMNIFILIQVALISLFAIIIILLFSLAARIHKRNIEDIAKKDINEPKRGGL